MMQTEGIRITREDRQEIERQIKECERKLDDLKAFGYDVAFNVEGRRLTNELRRLRRMR